MSSMSIFEIIGGIAMMLLSIAIALMVLMQEGTKGGGLASLGGGADSFYNKNQGRSTQQILARFTKYAAIAFFVITIGVYAADVLL